MIYDGGVTVVIWSVICDSEPRGIVTEALVVTGILTGSDAALMESVSAGAVKTNDDGGAMRET